MGLNLRVYLYVGVFQQRHQIFIGKSLFISGHAQFKSVLFQSTIHHPGLVESTYAKLTGTEDQPWNYHPEILVSTVLSGTNTLQILWEDCTLIKKKNAT